MARFLATFTVLATLVTLAVSASAASLSYLPKRLERDKCNLLVLAERLTNVRRVNAAGAPTPYRFPIFMADEDGKFLTPAAKPRAIGFISQLTQIAALGSSEFIPSSTIRIALNSDQTIMQSSAYSDFAQLNLPLSVLEKDLLTAEESFIIAHEYGHIQYDQFLREFSVKNRLPPWAPEKAILSPEFPDWLSRRDFLALELMPTNQLGVSMLLEGEPGDAAAEVHVLNQKIHGVKVDINSIHYLLEQEASAFHEVAADAWSLVQSGDPSFWARLAPDSSLDHYIRDWRFSDFEALLEVPGVYERILADPHVLLMKVRHQLWDFYYTKFGMVPGIDPEYDALFLKGTMSALAEAQFGLVRARATMTLDKPPKVAALALLKYIEDAAKKQLQPMLKRQLEVLREMILIMANGPIALEDAGINAKKLTQEQLNKLIEQYDLMSDILDMYNQTEGRQQQTTTVTIPNYQPEVRERERAGQRTGTATRTMSATK